MSDIINVFDEAKQIRKSPDMLKNIEVHVGDGVDNVKMKATSVAS